MASTATNLVSQITFEPPPAPRIFPDILHIAIGIALGFVPVVILVHTCGAVLEVSFRS